MYTTQEYVEVEGYFDIWYQPEREPQIGQHGNLMEVEEKTNELK